MVSIDEFLAGLTGSGLMTAEEVHAFRVSLPPSEEPMSVKVLATELVRRGRLTKYQAGRIATGRSSGLVLGKYVIQDKIGEGGMGEVFVAEHRRMKRPVVVKILPAAAMSSASSIERFQREVEAAAQLSHPNIVTAFDADEEDGVHFLVMEHVDGEPLGDLATRQGPLRVQPDGREWIRNPLLRSTSNRQKWMVSCRRRERHFHRNRPARRPCRSRPS